MTSSFSIARRAVLVLAMLATVAAPASADWLLTPYLGLNFGGNANFGDVGDFEDNFEKKAVFGGSLAWMGAGAFGFELDLGVAPNFFENTSGDANFDFGDSNLTTVMANVLIGAPVGGQTGPGLRPYVAGGIGLMRASISPTGLFNDLSTSELGVNVGGGIIGFFSDTVGVRGDVRYFRQLQDREPDSLLDLGLSSFRFWRGTLGVTFRF